MRKSSPDGSVPCKVPRLTFTENKTQWTTVLIRWWHKADSSNVRDVFARRKRRSEARLAAAHIIVAGRLQRSWSQIKTFVKTERSNSCISAVSFQNKSQSGYRQLSCSIFIFLSKMFTTVYLYADLTSRYQLMNTCYTCINMESNVFF